MRKQKAVKSRHITDIPVVSLDCPALVLRKASIIYYPQ